MAVHVLLRVCVYVCMCVCVSVLCFWRIGGVARTVYVLCVSACMCACVYACMCVCVMSFAY